MTKERPILFSTPMVKSILKGGKTVTRRVINKINIQRECDGEGMECFSVFDKKGNQYYDESEGQPFTLRDLRDLHYARVGDILWVRETWAKYVAADCVGGVTTKYRYKADDKDECYQWKPSIHMPKFACRLKLEVTSIGVEKLHDITEEDALKEGANFWVHGHGFVSKSEIAADPGYLNFGNYKTGFQQLWISINGKESWDLNPWVWRIEFKKLESNLAVASNK